MYATESPIKGRSRRVETAPGKIRPTFSLRVANDIFSLKVTTPSVCKKRTVAAL